ncbi:hypothetical protein [Vibrio parahaemolyticus]|uniref:hypothetical protein n=1 Tax=Vibrio parahaemolyticus TaxID=670 RepID=UPI0025526464|nr:hypothetical protein [Vibrio parahaemolyticus]
MEIVKDWIIPILSIVLSGGSILLAVWFSASAKKDSDNAQATLSQVNAAIQGWQKQIMESTVSILDSTPQVIEGKAALAKIEAAQALVESLKTSINEIAANPKPGAAGHTQQENLKIVTEQLNTLLSSMSEVKTKI